MNVVLDASVLAKILFPEQGSDEAAEIARRTDPLAPDLVDSEIVNAIWKRTRRRDDGITQAEAEDALDVYLALPIRRRATAPLVRQALDLAIALSHPAYDCFYLALAAREGVPLVTADERLGRKARLIGGAGISVLTLPDAVRALPLSSI